MICINSNLLWSGLGFDEDVSGWYLGKDIWQFPLRHISKEEEED